jgi:hypothetical protein
MRTDASDEHFQKPQVLALSSNANCFLPLNWEKFPKIVKRIYIFTSLFFAAATSNKLRKTKP